MENKMRKSNSELLYERTALRTMDINKSAYLRLMQEAEKVINQMPTILDVARTMELNKDTTFICADNKRGIRWYSFDGGKTVTANKSMGWASAATLICSSRDLNHVIDYNGYRLYLNVIAENLGYPFHIDGIFVDPSVEF
jgi:hypothetical protein